MATRRKSVRKKPCETARALDERKRTAEAIQSTDAYIQALMGNALDGIVVLNRDGTIRYRSPFIERVLGREQGEREGKSAFEFIHPDDLPRASNLFAELQQSPGATMFEEMRVLHEDGSVRTIEIVGQNLIDSPVVMGIVANLRDITERKLAEEALHRQKEWYRSLIENSLDAIVVLNRDGTPRYISPSSERLQGYGTGELNVKNTIANVHPDDMPMATEAFAQLVDDPSRTLHTEVRSQRKDGSWLILEVVGRNLLDDPRVNGIVCSYRDITERKKAEEALKLSEKKFKSFVEQMNDGYCVIQDSQIVFANARIASMFGYTQDDVIGRGIHRFLSPETTWQLIEAHGKRRRGEEVPPQYETVLTTKGGTSYPIEFSTKLIEYAGRPATSVVIRDITERKEMEKAIREEEERFRALIENAQDAIVIINGEGIMHYISPSYEHMMGYKLEDIVANDLFERIHPDDISRVSQEFAQILQTPGATLRSEVRAQHQDGSWRYIEAVAQNLLDSPKVAGIVVNLRDVTEGRWAEQEVRQSEERLKRYLDNSPDVIVVVDTGGIIHYANTTARRMTGYSAEELVGQNFLNLGLLASSNLSKPTQWLASGGAEKPIKENEYEIVKKDGNVMVVEVSTIPLGHVPGTTRTEIVAIARDITERKVMEEEKQRMEEQLQLASQLAAVGELAAGVAHELNNPLAAVQAFAEFLAEKQDLDDTIKADIQTIYQESQRAAKITSNLLSFARKRKPEKRFISINEALDKSLELHSYRLKVNNIEVVKELHPSLPWTMADFHQMQQVFVNIITNSEQAMTEAHGKGKLIVKTQKKGDVIQITFSDDGPGISEEDLKSIFNPFFTTKEVGEGTGLGLSICYGIVQEHGGALYAKSKPGDGATFIVEIPIVQEQISEEQVELTAPWGI